MPEPANRLDEPPDTREHQRDIDDLLRLLATAHRNLDAAGVPRTTPT